MRVRSGVAHDASPAQDHLVAWFLDQPQPDPSVATAAPLTSPPDDGAARLRRLIETTISDVFGVAHSDLCRRSRGKAPVALARQAAMYLAHVTCGLNLTDVGRIFSRDRTTVAHACAVIEDRRDDPVFDRALELMEWIVPTLIGDNAHHFHRDF